MVATDFCVDIELGEGVWLEPSPGHSPGHVCVHVTGGGKHALLAGDAIHHPLQLTHPNLSIAAHFDRAQAEATRRHMLERCADTPTLLLTGPLPLADRGPRRRAQGQFPVPNSPTTEPSDRKNYFTIPATSLRASYFLRHSNEGGQAATCRAA